MILETLLQLWQETIQCVETVTPTTEFTLKSTPFPPFNWLCNEAAKALQAYSKGLSKAVLLTELESKW